MKTDEIETKAASIVLSENYQFAELSDCVVRLRADENYAESVIRLKFVERIERGEAGNIFLFFASGHQAHIEGEDAEKIWKLFWPDHYPQ